MQTHGSVLNVGIKKCCQFVHIIARTFQIWEEPPKKMDTITRVGFCTENTLKGVNKVLQRTQWRDHNRYIYYMGQI